MIYGVTVEPRLQSSATSGTDCHITTDCHATSNTDFHTTPTTHFHIHRLPHHLSQPHHPPTTDYHTTSHSPTTSTTDYYTTSHIHIISITDYHTTSTLHRPLQHFPRQPHCTDYHTTTHLAAASRSISLYPGHVCVAGRQWAFPGCVSLLTLLFSTRKRLNPGGVPAHAIPLSRRPCLQAP